MAQSKNLQAIARRSKLIDLPDGKHVEIAALTLADFAFIQEEAASAAKRELLKTYGENADMLPKDRRDEIVLDAFKRAEEIRSDTISAERVTGWLKNSLRGKLCAIWRSMLASMPGLTYDDAAAIWANAGAKDDDIEEAADEVGQLSRATLGNGSPPPAKPEAEGATMAG